MITKTLFNISNTSGFAKLFCFIISLFAPISALIYFLVLLVITDAFTGICWKAQTIGKNTTGFKNKALKIFHIIECDKFLQTLEKLLFYIILVFVLYYFDILILHNIPLVFNGLSTFSLANIATLLISLSELTSILKNISRITSIPILSKLMSYLTNSNKSLFKKQ
jgi:hypothetical protein